MPNSCGLEHRYFRYKLTPTWSVRKTTNCALSLIHDVD